jgi:NADPH-dependent glutamate synthase beta chain and related oxidoreductases
VERNFVHKTDCVKVICVIEQSGHGTVTIGSIEKYITETAGEKGWVKPIQVAEELEQSIGIIGAGPAGLACGEKLRKKGYQITILQFV